MFASLFEMASGQMTFQHFNTVSPVVSDYFDEFMETKTHADIAKLPLMENGFLVILSIMATYLYFVKVWGPRMMANRKPYDLKPLILTHNISLSIFNFYFFIFTLKQSTFGADFWKCSPLELALREDKDYKLWVIWIYIMSKLLIFHVVHHTMYQSTFGSPLNMPLLSIWFCFPASTPWFTPSCMPIMRYQPSVPLYVLYLWWKKYLTTLQISQFVLVLINYTYLGAWSDCKIPKFMFILGFPQVALIMVMFISFFIKTYIQTKPSSPSSSLSSSTSSSSSSSSPSSTAITSKKSQ
ncbi:elongation of very long chain fatty acids protein 1-like [Tetranychus urticae]|uniref:elongation of very long chain fatty acids protein 1-like n=1 Tax=Tetranychus urticae TaxID=32264 RepID=UPI000D6501BD|nr:elongation of very long chain fatty acids protein 1-like [Tetranychus urticae]